MSTSSREDGRSPNTLRPLSANQGLLNKADGSACFAQGNTVVLAAVYGPNQKFDSEKINKGSLNIVYKPSDGSPGAASVESQRLIAESLKEVVAVSSFPQATLNVTVQVLNNEGSTLAAAFNAVTLALLDSGIEQNGLVTSVCCAVLSNGEISVDPTTKELETSVASMTTAWHSVSGEMLTCTTTGIFTRVGQRRCLESSKSASVKVLGFLRAAYKSRLAIKLN
jgi:exosome complex component RRP46